MPATESTSIDFHGAAFTVTTTIQEGEALGVEVEQQSEATRWRGQFTAQYIEDISAKTGNFKKFSVFVRMLASAIKQESDSVFVDLLTYSDLETLKSKKVAGRAPLQRTIPPNNKRYLILTYAAEFDRVHYPLPLLYEQPTVEHLQLVVQQLRAELGQSTGPSSKAKHSESAAEVRRLRDENAALQRQLAETEQQACSTSASNVEHLQTELAQAQQEVALLQKECELMQQRAEAAEITVERERGLHRRELRRRAKELADMQEELVQAHEQIGQLRMQCRNVANDLDATRRQAAVRSSRPLRTAAPARPDRPSVASRGSSPATTRPLSRPSSRAPSRDSRAPSPALSRRSTGSAGSGARTQSAPSPRPRFDPTEYVRQRQERQYGPSDRFRRQSPSPSRPPSRPLSRPPSGQSSPAHSRASSVERQRESIDRLSQPRHLGMQSPKTRRPRGSPARLDSQGVARNAPRVRHGGNQETHDNPGRAQSPGRALQDIKAKLNQFAGAQQPPGLDKAHEPCKNSTVYNVNDVQNQPVEQPAVLNSASAEIADIDQRLHALQTFLKAAKAGAPAPGKVI